MERPKPPTTLRDQITFARSLIPKEGPVSVNHDPSRFDTALARTYFEEAGCPQAFIDFVLTETDRWKDFCTDCIDVYSLSPTKLNKALKKCLDNTYSLANGSLDRVYEHGFNKHDKIHINHVTKNVRKLLKLAGEKKPVIRRAVLATRGHDLGNILSRKYHSLVSPYILSKVVNQVLPDGNLDIRSKERIDKARDWRIVRRAMQLHNEPIASQLIESFRYEYAKDGERKALEQSEEQIVERMRKRFGAEALALIIADKTDIGKHRISQKAKGYKAVDEDQHLEVNLLGETKNISLSHDKKMFNWDLLFRPGMSEDEALELSRFARQSESRGRPIAYVSDKTHALHHDYQIPHFLTWNTLFWQLYYERVVLTVRSAFALYPTLERFCITTTDTDSKTQLQFTFEKEKLRTQFDKLKQMYIKKDVRKNRV
ncbi:MAG: hypothetical protein ABI758_01700 [Candidatus Woesebacteria bacterium]